MKRLILAATLAVMSTAAAAAPADCTVGQVWIEGSRNFCVNHEDRIATLETEVERLKQQLTTAQGQTVDQAFSTNEVREILNLSTMTLAEAYELVPNAKYAVRRYAGGSYTFERALKVAKRSGADADDTIRILIYIAELTGQYPPLQYTQTTN